MVLLPLVVKTEDLRNGIPEDENALKSLGSRKLIHLS